jgi:hypothetical protein
MGQARIVILGAGTDLGAAWRLREFGHAHLCQR